MGLQFYKPNKTVKGALASFQFNSKDGALYLQLVRQTSYDEKRHIGGFKDGAKINVKFNANEIGGFLRALRELGEAKFIHTTPDKTTNITFSAYSPKDSEKIVGFGLSVLQAGEVFRIPFNLDEGYLLEEYLKYVLTHFFDAIYSEDKQRAIQYQEKKNSGNGSSEAKSAKASPKAEEPEEVTLEDDDLF